jgi:hypothetical protein
MGNLAKTRQIEHPTPNPFRRFHHGIPGRVPITLPRKGPGCSAAVTKLAWETYGRRFRRGQRPAPNSFVTASKFEFGSIASCDHFSFQDRTVPS